MPVPAACRLTSAACLSCRYADLEKIEGIVKSMRVHIENAAGVDLRLPQGAGLAVRSCAGLKLAHSVEMSHHHAR